MLLAPPGPSSSEVARSERICWHDCHYTPAASCALEAVQVLCYAHGRRLPIHIRQVLVQAEHSLGCSIWGKVYSKTEQLIGESPCGSEDKLPATDIGKDEIKKIRVIRQRAAWGRDKQAWAAGPACGEHGRLWRAGCTIDRCNMCPPCSYAWSREDQTMHRK